MMRKYFALILFMLFFYSNNPAMSFPGDHEGYTCNGWRSVTCSYDHFTGEIQNPMPGNAINPACAAEIHNPDYNITQFGDSLSDLVDWFYGLASFNRYYEIMGMPNINVQNFGISGARSKTVAWNTAEDPWDKP